MNQHPQTIEVFTFTAVGNKKPTAPQYKTIEVSTTLNSVYLAKLKAIKTARAWAIKHGFKNFYIQ